MTELMTLDNFPDEIKKYVLLHNLNFIDVNKFITKVKAGLVNTISVQELYRYCSETAASMITQHPEYERLAAVILATYHTATTLFSFTEKILLYNEYTSNINPEILDIIIKNKDIFDSIPVYSRDFELSYFSINSLLKSYVLRVESQPIERMQDVFLRVAIQIHKADFDKVKETYDLFSLGYYTHGTPTLFNSILKKCQLASCFLVTPKGDDIGSIFDTIRDCALISKHSGGLGVNLHDIRCEGSSISTGGVAKGIVPIIKIINETMKYVNQGGSKRQSSVAFYLEPWHADILSFLDLRKNTGSEEFRARDIFTAIWMNDLFMERVLEGAEWSLFDPKEARGLSEVYGDDFKKLYIKYEKTLSRKVMPAQSLWKSIIITQIETGTPYILYKDTCNKLSNQNHLGTIKSSNLCAEIIEFSSRDETAVCNLASICLPKFVKDGCFDFNLLKNVVKIVVKNLNKIIDSSYYPLTETSRSNFKHRPIGIGVQGLADVFAMFKYPFESQSARTLNKLIFETMYFASLESSNELAIIEGPHESFKGSYLSRGIFQFELTGTQSSGMWEWEVLRKNILQYGVKNSLFIALMPTAGTSQIYGNNECFEPFTSNLYTRRTFAGEFQVVNTHLMRDLDKLGLWSEEMRNLIIEYEGSIQNIPGIPQDLKNIYKTIWEIKMKAVIDLAAERQPYVDQSQSLNIYLQQPTYQQLSSMHFYGWKKGLKTGMYYLRTRPITSAIKFTVNQELVDKTLSSLKDYELSKSEQENMNNTCESCQSYPNKILNDKNKLKFLPMVKKTILDYFTQKSKENNSNDGSKSFENYTLKTPILDSSNFDLNLNTHVEKNTKHPIDDDKLFKKCLNSEMKIASKIKNNNNSSEETQINFANKSKEKTYRSEKYQLEHSRSLSNKIDEFSTLNSEIINQFLETVNYNTVENLESVFTHNPNSDNYSADRYSFLLDIKDNNGVRKGDPGYNPSKLYIPEICYKKFTPFEKQFWDIKKEYFDVIIFFKKGKFYELYEDDAMIASKLFDLKIAERVNMKMAGVPESSYDSWAAKFVQAGYKIGRVEQKENAIGKKIREHNGKKDKIIERELTEVITSGTVYSEDYILNPLPIYLAVIVLNEDYKKNLKIFNENGIETCNDSLEFSVLLYDASINKIVVNSFCDNNSFSCLKTIFVQNNIKEVITDFRMKIYEFLTIIDPINDIISSCRKYEFEREEEFKCFGYLYNYMKLLKRESVLESAEISYFMSESLHMILDGATIINLDIFANNNDSTENHTLFKSINHCSTPFGQRLLKKWLLSPLMSQELIKSRHELSNLFENLELYHFITTLKSIGDIERRLGKLRNNKPTYKDLSLFISSLKQCQSFTFLLTNEFKDKRIIYDIALIHHSQTSKILMGFENSFQIIDDKIEPHDDNDELFTLKKHFEKVKSKLEAFLSFLKEELSCNQLCFKHLGKEIYQIETPANVIMPEGFFIVSCTKTHKRYYSLDLKKMIGEYQEVEELIFQSQGNILSRAINFFVPFLKNISELIGFIASIDCNISFNIFSRINETSIPEFSDHLKMIGISNPIYPKNIKNDFSSKHKITLITGPNMGGKSTLLRSVCINIILAQMGMKVLCKYMSLPLFDKIFTRIGASDSLARGESTFMVEMNEASKILNQCTARSFIIMDELGRGTSTREGSIIASSVLEYLKYKGCYVMFATHYHDLVKTYSGVNKLFVNCKIEKEDIVFLYKIEEGVNEDSYGLYVARMAGVPNEFINEAIKFKESLMCFKKN